jgi:hypothetical protein
LHFCADGLDFVDADVGVPDDPPVGDDPLRLVAEGKEDRRLVAVGDRDVGRIALHLAAKAEPKRSDGPR